MSDGVVRQRLDRVIVRIFEDSLQFVGPDDHTLVRASTREPLPIPSIGHAVDCVLVSLQWLYERTIRGIIDQNSLTSSNYDLTTIRPGNTYNSIEILFNYDHL